MVRKLQKSIKKHESYSRKQSVTFIWPTHRITKGYKYKNLMRLNYITDVESVVLKYPVMKNFQCFIAKLSTIILRTYLLCNVSVPLEIQPVHIS